MISGLVIFEIECDELTCLVNALREKRNNPQLAHVMCYALLGVSCEKRKNVRHAHAMCYALLGVSCEK